MNCPGSLVKIGRHKIRADHTADCLVCGAHCKVGLENLVESHELPERYARVVNWINDWPDNGADTNP